MPHPSPAGSRSRPRYSGTAQRIGKYPGPDAVQVIAREFGVQFSTARQILNVADLRNPWLQAARGTAALYRAGLVQRAELLCQHIDLARVALLPVAVDREAVRAALIAEQEAEGMETAAQVAIYEFTPAEWDTWRRRAMKETAATMHAVRLGDAYFQRAS